MEKKARSKKKLATKIAKICFIFALLVSVCNGVIFAILSYQYEVDQYAARAFAVTHTIAGMLDKETVQHYLQTKKKDGEYLRIEKELNLIRENNGFDYVYVGKINPDYTISYLWGSFKEDESYVNTEIGFSEELSEDVKKRINEGNFAEEFFVFTVPGDGLFGNAHTDILDENGQRYATVSIDVNMNRIVSEFCISFIELLGITVVVAFFGGWLLYRRVSRRIVEPLLSVKDAVDNMIDHIEDGEIAEIECRTNDEIEDLADAFSIMNADIKAYISEIKNMTAEQQRIASDLETAAKIQDAALEHEFPNTPNYELLACMFPAKEVGGDFYDFYDIDESHVGIFIADVSGKGVPAALLMISAKTFMKNSILFGKSLEESFSLANERIYKNNEEGFFITALGGILDLKTGEFRFVNAGHLPPFIRHSGGQFVKRPVKADLVLGCFSGTQYHVDSIMLEPGDRLYLYTDGTIEGMDPDKNEYGFDRLLESMNRHAAKKPYDFLVGLFEDGADFIKTEPQFDDITMICLDFKAKME